MDSKIPQSLREKQELQRQQTVNRILRAVEDLQAQGCRLSIKNMMDYTGLSRSTFAKPHVREVLSRYGCSPGCDDLTAESREKAKKRKQSEKQREKDERIQRLTEENLSLKHDCELLRGRLFLLMQRQQNL